MVVADNKENQISVPSAAPDVSKSDAADKNVADDPLAAFRFGHKASARAHEQPQDIKTAKSFISEDNFQIDHSLNQAFAEIGSRQERDQKGNVYRSMGTDVAIRSNDGGQTFIKKGDQEELATATSEQLYNTKTLDATYRDRATGTELINSRERQTFEMVTARGGDTIVALGNEGKISSAFGKQLRYDKNGNPQLIENMGGAVRSQIVLGQAENGQTQVTVHTTDGSVQRQGDDYKFYGLAGVPLQDGSGKALVLSQNELSDPERWNQLPAQMRAKLKVEGNDVVFNGIKIRKDGYDHDGTSVNRDSSGRIEARTLNADNLGHTEVDVIDKEHAQVKLLGVFSTEIAGGKAVTTSAQGKILAAYDYVTGKYTTKDATFSSSGTDVKFAGAHVDADSGNVTSADGSTSPGSPAYVAMLSSAENAAVNAQALAQRAGADARAVTALSSSLYASASNLEALRAYCLANNIADAIPYLDSGLTAVYGALGGSPSQAGGKA